MLRSRKRPRVVPCPGLFALCGMRVSYLWVSVYICLWPENVNYTLGTGLGQSFINVYILADFYLYFAELLQVSMWHLLYPHKNKLRHLEGQVQVFCGCMRDECHASSSEFPASFLHPRFVSGNKNTFEPWSFITVSLLIVKLEVLLSSTQPGG